MSYINVTARPDTISQHIEMPSSGFIGSEVPASGSLVRGLAYGLVLGLSFWTLVLVEILRH